MVVSHMVSGIEIRDGKAALWGAVCLGLANGFVKPLLLAVTFPITILTLGLFVFIVNALMLQLAAAFVDGFEVEGLGSAIWGGIWLSVLNLLVGMLFGG
jgi:putative membrane protein